jgi:predicted nucleic acid-binding protein
MPENFPENKVVVTDTSCFILLQKINAIHLLHDLFATIVTTPEIAKEYGNPLPVWVIIQAVSNPTIQEKFNQYVDPGEASAIALALEIKSDYVILDDLEARKFAEKIGLSVKGTMGLLLSSKQKGLIPLVSPYIHLIQQTNFRISQFLINQIMKDAGE